MSGESPPPELTRLLLLASTFHENSAEFSLKQLVSIHSSLLQAIANNNDSNDATTTEEYTSLLQQQDYSEAQQLLILQYLMEKQHQPLQALATLVLPYLFNTCTSSEFQEALLDAVFFNSIEEENVHHLLQECFDACRAHEQEWSVKCRVLSRLYNYFSNDESNTTTSSLQQATLEIVFQQVVQAIQLSFTCPNYKQVMHCCITWLLPLLFSSSSMAISSANQIDQLWILLLLQSQLESKSLSNSQVALVVSVVQCSILPFLLDTALPTTTCKDDDDDDDDDDITSVARATPIHQPVLWDFIFYSLSQGMDNASLTPCCQEGEFKMLRKRGLYLLRILVESDSTLKVWHKFLLCLQALEMETECHLVDQVWETVAEICGEVENKSDLTIKAPPSMSWKWIQCMLARVLLSDAPILRKLALYRFLSGRIVSVNVSDTMNTTATIQQSKQPQSKKGKKKQASTTTRKAPITIISTDFVLCILLPSYDSLEKSVGTNLMLDENGKIETHDVTLLLQKFLEKYCASLDINDQRYDFIIGLVEKSTICNLRLKTLVLVFEAVANTKNDVEFSFDPSVLEIAVESFGVLFAAKSIVAAYRQRLLHAFATMLSHSSCTDPINPVLLLKILALYPIPEHENHSLDVDNKDDLTFGALQMWLSKMSTSMSSVGAACASAFVMSRQLLPPPTSEWTPISGSTETERQTGDSIVLLCALSTESNASELLWPAISKGLAAVPQGYPWLNVVRTSRAIILLIGGCRMNLISGVGNGDLVMTKNQTQMMPPPARIEALLSNAAAFMLCHIEALTSLKGVAASSKSTGARSGVTARVSSTLARLISQIKVLCNSYPSSLAVSSVADTMLETSMVKLASNELSAIGVVQNTALAFGALSCGATARGDASTVESCRFILNLSFPGNKDGTVSNVQTARSVFQYAKWGALSFLLRALVEVTTDSSSNALESEKSSLLSDLFHVAEDSVYATPADALLPLFDSLVTGARYWLVADNNNKDDTGDGADLYAKKLQQIISSLFNMLSEAVSGRAIVYMLNEMCALLFRPELLMSEYELVLEHDEAATPIRDAFRRLMEMASTTRPHISKIAMSYITSAWIGNDPEDKAAAGRASPSAIPYRSDICDLLLHKEVKLEQSSVIQESDILVGPNEVSPGTDEASIARGFVLLFFSNLPDANDGLPRATLTNLLHFTILYLLDKVCLVENTGVSIMIGSFEYSQKIRAWQALCVLARFVSDDIAHEVCDKVFVCMGQNLHGQIRYFLEAFAIQCARLHPPVFGQRLVKEIRRKNLSLQNVSSLMIIAGNLLVGRYKSEFLSQVDTDGESPVDLKEILAGIVPWLSSTQGFSRGISQLLVHNLVPTVININESAEASGLKDSDWFLGSIYEYLNENKEMARLRKKQAKFFHRYDVDEICSAEHILTLQVDEGMEASPKHLVDAMKTCLEEVYLEAHEHETPEWKQVAEMMEQTSVDDQSATTTAENDELVNFQRKIIPLDSLELDLGASRNARLKNARGRIKKQSLVVVASLIDKVPNLAGLARTSEIFAAERLVIPDTSVCRMDNFKSISVGAGEWIDIEGVREDQLLDWLRKQKEKGYMIVGVEQTSSSKPLSDHKFSERTVLLLGKEKEGIPVEFLQVVDVCVEIPQQGVIRSLNVHVSGALAIWEYTRQFAST